MRSSRFSIAFLLFVTLTWTAGVIPSQGSGLHLAAGQSSTTLTITLTTTRTYYSEAVTVDGTDSNPGTTPPCGWASLQFQATKGQNVSMSLKSTGPPISFYVMSDSARKNWKYYGNPVLGGTPNSVSPCHGRPVQPPALLSQDGIASYTGCIVFPADGTYWLWFININKSKTSFRVNFDMLGSPTVLTSTTVLAASSQPTTPTTATTAPPQTGTQTFGSMFYSAPAIIVMGAIAAVAVACALVFARRRKAVATVVTRPEAVQPTVTQSEADSMQPARETFCINCRTQLPPNASFCDECGAPQNGGLKE